MRSLARELVGDVKGSRSFEQGRILVAGATNSTLENGLAALAFARRITLGLLEDVPLDKLLHQPFPGANHAMWILGHIACADDWFLRTLGPRPSQLPEGWDELFGSGASLRTDSAAYPSWTQVLDQAAARREELVAWFRSLTEDELGQALPENLQPFGATNGVLMSTLAWHEGLHAGQLTTVRRSLGLAPRFR